jgi:hypothetical protein
MARAAGHSGIRVIFDVGVARSCVRYVQPFERRSHADRRELAQDYRDPLMSLTDLQGRLGWRAERRRRWG